VSNSQTRTNFIKKVKKLNDGSPKAEVDKRIQITSLTSNLNEYVFRVFMPISYYFRRAGFLKKPINIFQCIKNRVNEAYNRAVAIFIRINR